MTAGGGGLRRRGYAAAANEAVDSLSNFIFSVWVAREVGAPEFGAFAIAYSIVQISVGVSQGVATMPMMVRYATSSWRTSRKVAGDVTGATLVVSILPVLTFAVLAASFHGRPLASCAVAFAVVVPGLLLQNTCVLTFYNREQTGLALLNNVTWLVVQLPLFVYLPRVVHSHHAWVYILGWGLAAYLATFISLAQMRVLPRVDHFGEWLRRRRSSIVDLSVENIVNRISTQSATWALAAVAGLKETAGVRAAQIPLGVPRIFIQGLAPMGLAEGTRLYARRPKALVTFIRWWAVANTVICALIGLGLVLLPEHLGRDLGGKSWPYARPILGFVILITIGNAVLVPAQTGLKCLGVTRISAVVRTMTAPLPALLTIAGGVFVSNRAAVVGMAIGSMVSGLVALGAFERQFRRTVNPPPPPVVRRHRAERRRSSVVAQGPLAQ
jgi:O-antigen/teichoic acid export membrane protein